MVKLSFYMSSNSLTPIRIEYANAYLDDVPSAVIPASMQRIKILKGFFLVHTMYIIDSVMKKWRNSPTSTVSMYMPSDESKFCRLAVLSNFVQIRLQMPIGENLSEN